jgi:hypothetical protein
MATIPGVAAARSASASSRRAAAKTRCPRRANSIAVARPIPELAPVTGSKDQLIAQTLDAKGPEIIGAYLPAEDGDAPPRQQILTAFDRLSWWTASKSYRGCPFVNTATELADALHPARDVARDYTLRIRAFFERQAARGGAEDPTRLANQLVAFFDGAIVQAVMGNVLDPGTIQTAVQALLDAADVR